MARAGSVERWQLAQLSHDDVIPLKLGLLLCVDTHDVQVVAGDLVALERLRAHIHHSTRLHAQSRFRTDTLLCASLTRVVRCLPDA